VASIADRLLLSAEHPAQACSGTSATSGSTTTRRTPIPMPTTYRCGRPGPWARSGMLSARCPWALAVAVALDSSHALEPNGGI